MILHISQNALQQTMNQRTRLLHPTLSYRKHHLCPSPKGSRVCWLMMFKFVWTAEFVSQTACAPRQSVNFVKKLVTILGNKWCWKQTKPLQKFLLHIKIRVFQNWVFQCFRIFLSCLNSGPPVTLTQKLNEATIVCVWYLLNSFFFAQIRRFLFFCRSGFEN